MTDLETTALSLTGTWLRPMAEHRALEVPVHVSRASPVTAVRWTIDLRQPSRVRTETIHFDGIAEKLADEIRIALLVSMAHPSSARRSAVSMAALGQSLTMIGRWMTHLGIGSFAELGEGCGTFFLEAVAQWFDAVRNGTHDPERGDWEPRRSVGKQPGTLGREGRPTRGLVTETARALLFLHRHAAVLEGYGGAAPRGKPFEEDNADAVAEGWTEENSNRTTRRLPDAVLARLMPGARRMLGVPANDVVRLVHRLSKLCASGLTEAEAAARLIDFRFGKVPGEEARWRERLVIPGLSPADSIRQIVHLIRDAGETLVFALGMRPAEALGLAGGTRPPQRFETAEARGIAGRAHVPWCVSEGPSKSGFSTAVHLHGLVYKRESTPRATRWLIGGRQAGEAEPDAVLALEVLERLHAPLRRFAPAEARGLLVVDFVSGQDEPLRTDVLTVGRFAVSLRRSIPRFAEMSDIPDKEMGHDLRRYREPGASCIALYQFRKTFAQTLYRLSPALLMAISRQLQHRSPEDTMKDYVTDDTWFRRELDLFRSRHTVLLFDEIMDGTTTASHTMDGSVDRVLARVAARGVVLDDAYRARLWAQRIGGPRSLFGHDHLRPTAGMAAALLGSSDLSPDVGIGADGGPDLARDGPELLRTYFTERRRSIARAANGNAAAGREARDRALAAARSFGSSGFRTKDAKASATGMTNIEGQE